MLVGGDRLLIDVTGDLHGGMLGLVIEHVLESRQLMLLQQSQPSTQQMPTTAERVVFAGSSLAAVS